MQCKPNSHPANSIRQAYSRYEYVRANINAVTTVSNILTPVCLFIQTSPIDFAVASGKANRLFTGELHVQIANKLRYRHHAILKQNYCPLPDPPNFSLPSFKATY